MLFTRCTEWLRNTTSTLLKQVIVVYCAGSDLRLKRSVRYLAIAVAAYAFSPIDLIPDFIPVLGLLDDIILVPVGVWLVLRLAPAELIAAARKRADELLQKPVNRIAGVFFIVIWLIAGGVLLVAVWRWLLSR